VTAPYDNADRPRAAMGSARDGQRVVDRMTTEAYGRRRRNICARSVVAPLPYSAMHERHIGRAGVCLLGRVCDKWQCAMLVFGFSRDEERHGVDAKIGHTPTRAKFSRPPQT
jgi:hypothetical protein